MKPFAPLLTFTVILLCGLAVLIQMSASKIDHWLDNPGHRLPNIRTVDASCRTVLIERFIALQDWSSPTLVGLGDSQIFAGMVDDQDTFLMILADALDMKAVNLAVMDGRPGDTARIANLLFATVGKVAGAVANLNQTHFSQEHIDTRHVLDAPSQVWDWTRCAYDMRRTTLEGQLEPVSVGEVAQQFVSIPLKPDTFQFDRARASAISKLMLFEIANLTESALVYVAPNATGQFHHYQEPDTTIEITQYRMVSSDLKQFCDASPVANCLDASEAVPDSGYADIIHFNEAGHQFFASWLFDRW